MPERALAIPCSPLIQVSDLSRRFGANVALDSVNLSLERGAVHGLVGANGAGKTTLIKHLLGLLRAETGSVRVFGLDPVADPVGVLSRVGYLSEDHDLPGWMRVHELLRYTRAFHPAWDEGYAARLMRDFALESETTVASLSRGQRARLGLLLALAHRPELLVLDEPSSGLDPVVRRDILDAILRTIAEEGRTVLFSSHLLEEVERVADGVTLIHHGRIALSAPLDTLRGSHRCVTLAFDAPQAEGPVLPGALRWEGHGTTWTALFRGEVADLGGQASQHGARIVAERTPSLDEIFVAHVGRPIALPEDR